MALFGSTEYGSDTGKRTDGKHIRGISCDVRNCVYHDGDNYCTAEKIAVGPSYATSCTDTVCATFKQRSL
ncbi:MAG: DUF1540 domain-containing protein [Clostridia bacterium]|nr:DUF1540 domain-containing protein [Clostridia bacterium]